MSLIAIDSFHLFTDDSRDAAPTIISDSQCNKWIDCGLVVVICGWDTSILTKRSLVQFPVTMELFSVLFSTTLAQWHGDAL